MRTTTIVFVTVLLTAAAAVAQPPLPVLQDDAPPNFYKSAMANPEDFSSSEVNASVQVYPFRPFAGNIQQLVGQTLLRDWIDPRYREENVASQPDFRSEIVPGAQAAFLVSFFENRVGLPRPHVRLRCRRRKRGRDCGRVGEQSRDAAACRPGHERHDQIRPGRRGRCGALDDTRIHSRRAEPRPASTWDTNRSSR